MYQPKVRGLTRPATFLLLLVLSACSSTVEEPGSSEGEVSSSSNPVVPRTLGAVSVRLPSRSADDVRQKAAELLALFPGDRTVAAENVRSAPQARGRVIAVAMERPSVRIDYESTTDTFELADVELARVRDGVDISEAGARARLNDVLQSLTARGIVAGNEFALSDAAFSPLIQGEGSSEGGLPTESIKEYVFFMPRRIGGIVLNDGGQRDLGLKVSIHRGGLLRRLRISGLGASITGNPSGVTATVDGPTLAARVETDFPGSEITPLGLRYSLGAAGGGEPREMFRVSSTTLTDGVEVKARAKIVYYSITNGTARPEIWPTPNPESGSSEPQRP